MSLRNKILLAAAAKFRRSLQKLANEIVCSCKRSDSNKSFHHFSSTKQKVPLSFARPFLPLCLCTCATTRSGLLFPCASGPGCIVSQFLRSLVFMLLRISAYFYFCLSVRQQRSAFISQWHLASMLLYLPFLWVCVFLPLCFITSLLLWFRASNTDLVKLRIIWSMVENLESKAKK